jgi:protein-disulfide isomerase
MFRRTICTFWALLALSLLAACGDAAGPAALVPSQSPATPAPQAPTAQASPVATRPAPTAVAAQPTTLASAGQTAAPPAADGGIPESVTAEGYHVLGSADAPVTLTMYSDFL